MGRRVLPLRHAHRFRSAVRLCANAGRRCRFTAARRKSAPPRAPQTARRLDIDLPEPPRVARAHALARVARRSSRTRSRWASSASASSARGSRQPRHVRIDAPRGLPLSSAEHARRLRRRDVAPHVPRIAARRMARHRGRRPHQLRLFRGRGVGPLRDDAAIRSTSRSARSPSLAGFVGSGLEYRYLVRIGSGDLLKYPLGIGKAPGAGAATSRRSRRSGRARSTRISPLFKRDTFVFLTLVGAALGWLGPFLAVFAAGAVGVLFAVSAP